MGQITTDKYTGLIDVKIRLVKIGKANTAK